MHRIISELRIIWQGYLQRLVGIRFGLSVLLLLVLDLGAAAGMDQYLVDYQLRITPWMMPHFFSINLYTAFYGFIICYMFSDLPFMNRTEMYGVLRLGRIRWFWDKIVVIVLECLTVTLIAAVLSIIVYIPYLEFDTDWGTAIYTMAYSSMSLLTDYNIFCFPTGWIIDRYTPIHAMLLAMLMLFLVTTAIVLLMFAISTWFGRMPALIFGLLLANMQLSADHSPDLMFLYYLSPYTWMMIGRYDKASFVGYYPTLRYCLIAVSVLIVIELIMIAIRSRTIEFQWNKEE